jgi:hypothetical protein
MTLKVIGAGVGRTGTHSLKVALEQLLGGPCHHMVEVFAHAETEVPVWIDAIEGRPVDWTSLMAGYRAQVDWPGASFWPELSDAFPDALVLLSVRAADEWYRSAINTIFAGMDAAQAGGDTWMIAMAKLLGDRFSDQFGDRDAMVAAYHRHNDEVRASIPARRLLEWTPSDGWEPICERLDLAVPAEPFPVTNTTPEFREMVGLPPLG